MPRLSLPALLGFLALAGCIYAPRGVEGLPTDEAWVALPLRGWLAEGRGRPEAVVACLSADCPHRLMVAVVALQGDDARAAAQIIENPEILSAHLRERDEADTDKRRKEIRTAVETRRLVLDRLRGFVVTLSREGGGRPPAHGAVLGRPEGDSLRIVLAIGENADVVEGAVRQVAEARLNR